MSPPEAQPNVEVEKIQPKEKLAQSASTSAQENNFRPLAQQLRIDSIRSTTEAGSGHPTSSMSAADLMAVLMSKYLHYDFNKPHNPNNDRLVFSKGHASPLLYSMYKAAGAIDDKELLTLRKLGSRLEGHPTPVLPWVDVATGSLGQGLPDAVGIALEGQYLDKLNYKIYVLLGDSEMAEGSIWEAMSCAGFYKLENLIAILDMNRLGQRGQTELGWNAPAYAERARAFGWRAIEINGHDYAAIDKAYGEAVRNGNGAPTMIVAKTEKGHGYSAVANKDGWHGKPLNQEQATQAIKELGGNNNVSVSVQKPQDAAPKVYKPKGPFVIPQFGEQYSAIYSTREAYGDTLKALGSIYEELVVLDAEVSNSTYADKFKKEFPDRFFEMYIAEQCMVGVATGFASRGKKVFASTFAAFLSRAYDFIRMAAVSRANIKLCGSHAGVSIGADGPSQMALEDLAMMRAVFGSTVLYPSDAVSTAQLVHSMIDLSGVCYLRTTREKTPVLYKPDEKFPIGGSKVLRQSAKDKATVIAAGITLHEALKAYDELNKQGIQIRVIDAYSVKPIDRSTIQKAASETGRLIIVEDHWPEGGIADAVLELFTDSESNATSSSAPHIVHLAVRHMPGSATPEEELDLAGISAKHIVESVKRAP